MPMKIKKIEQLQNNVGIHKEVCSMLKKNAYSVEEIHKETGYTTNQVWGAFNKIKQYPERFGVTGFQSKKVENGQKYYWVKK